VSPHGVLEGRVTAGRATPDQVRLLVDAAGIGEVDAVASLDAHPGAGDLVRLAVDVTRLAVLPAE
jgi:thiamine transport system ATP-binding protein